MFFGTQRITTGGALRSVACGDLVPYMTSPWQPCIPHCQSCGMDQSASDIQTASTIFTFKN